MPDLFEITLADGIPVAGDGDVKTINSLMEDGALATIGRLTDTAVATYDANPASAIALLKQVSKTLQDLREDWPGSLGTGGGLKVESSNNPITVKGAVDVSYKSGGVIQASFTCGTIAYAANDVVGTAASSGVISFPGIVATSPAVLEIESVMLDIYRNTVITGETGYRLHLYDTTPPSAIADSSPMDITAADRAGYLGFIDIPVVEAIGSTVHAEVNNVRKVIKAASPVIYGYLVTKGPYNPTAATYRVTLGARVI